MVNLLYIFFILITASATEATEAREWGHRNNSYSYNPIYMQNDTMHSTSHQPLLAVPNSIVWQGNSCFPFKGLNWPKVNLFGKMRKKAHNFIFYIY